LTCPIGDTPSCLRRRTGVSAYRLTVTPGGLIFLAIVVLWAVYLVPVWARDRANAAAAREARLEAEQLRGSDRSQPRVLLSAGRPTMTTSAKIGALASAKRDLAAQRRAMRRRRAGRSLGLLLGLLAIVGSTTATVLAAAPWWSILAAGIWVTTAGVSGVLGAAHDRQVLAAARARVRSATTLQPAPSLYPTSRAVPLFDRGAGAEPVAPRESGRPSDGTWTPVTIPRPMYTMAPRVAHAPVLPWVETAPAPRPAPQPLDEPEAAPLFPAERRRAAAG